MRAALLPSASTTGLSFLASSTVAHNSTEPPSPERFDTNNIQLANTEAAKSSKLPNARRPSVGKQLHLPEMHDDHLLRARLNGKAHQQLRRDLFRLPTSESVETSNASPFSRYDSMHDGSGMGISRGGAARRQLLEEFQASSPDHPPHTSSSVRAHGNRSFSTGSTGVVDGKTHLEQNFEAEADDYLRDTAMLAAQLKINAELFSRVLEKDAKVLSLIK